MSTKKAKIFQFYKVRLKQATTPLIYTERKEISILQSSIKTEMAGVNYNYNEQDFNSTKFD